MLGQFKTAAGNADYTVIGPTFGTCTGNSQRSGQTTMRCDTGFRIVMDTPDQRAKM
ncbi:hypothetical protein [Algirhabdus cladophorae]|uniref:hypothetical protein n=1 Tax=Algirhabdus cladophorae TaxID=3377108 RepID=UPI003B8493B0